MGERTDTQTKNEAYAVYKRVSLVQTPRPIIDRSENLWWRKAGFGVTFFPVPDNRVCFISLLISPNPCSFPFIRGPVRKAQTRS